jgi:hypothetical protein
MTKLSKVIYIVMTSITVLGMVLDATKGHFDSWKFNTLCWVGIAFINEKRAAKVEKKHEELLNDIHGFNS